MESLKIELLSCQLLNENQKTLADILLLQEGLFKEVGWHYYVDLVWVVSTLLKMGIQPGATILDAGAGNGLLQYLLCMYGYNVLSVDFSPRKINPLAKFLFFIDKKERNQQFINSYIDHVNNVSSLNKQLNKLDSIFLKKKINLFSFVKLFFRVRTKNNNVGKITLFQSDMQNMNEIPEKSVDAIVSVSAIEHMEIDSIKLTVNEFHRVLKKGHPMIITTSAAKSKDWYHQPSEGWCFSLKTLSSFFSAKNEVVKGFGNYEEVLHEYKTNTFLVNHLARAYFLSDKTGMPNGIWAPQYVPVGIIAF